MTQENKKIAVAAVVALALGWFVATSMSSGKLPNPFVPQKPDRPFLKFVVHAAKTCLWVFMWAEPRPQLPATHVVHAAIGPDGHEYLNHAEGF